MLDMTSESELCAPGPLPGPAERGETLLSVEGVRREFPTNGGSPLVVLQDFHLSVRDIHHKPQVVSLLGPSGVGKTTALRLISGLDRPDRGRVRLHDARLGRMRDVRAGDVGVVFQSYPLFDDLTVLDNLVAPAVRGGASAGEAKEKALLSLEEFGLLDHRASWPLQLSGGQRQRVAILQQLMPKRHFVILDEPFSGLDPVTCRTVLKLIERVAHEHTWHTFIIVTHDVTSALLASDRVYLLGRERDAAGEVISGARVVREYDLIEEGLTYRPDAEGLPRFNEKVRGVSEALRVSAFV